MLGRPERGLHVLGLSRISWPDRISSNSFGRDYATAVATCEKRYAVSPRSKQIQLYHTTTCQESRQIESLEPISLLGFAHGNAETSPISVIVEHHTSDFILHGRENGSVEIYEATSGKPKQKLLDSKRLKCSSWPGIKIVSPDGNNLWTKAPFNRMH